MTLSYHGSHAKHRLIQSTKASVERNDQKRAKILRTKMRTMTTRKRSNKMKKRKKMMSRVNHSLDLRRKKVLILKPIQRKKSKRKNKLP